MCITWLKGIYIVWKKDLWSLDKQIQQFDNEFMEFEESG